QRSTSGLDRILGRDRHFRAGNHFERGSLFKRRRNHCVASRRKCFGKQHRKIIPASAADGPGSGGGSGLPGERGIHQKTFQSKGTAELERSYPLFRGGGSA